MTGKRFGTVRVIEIAELLGLTEQRAHQIAEEKGAPGASVMDLWPKSLSMALGQ